MRKFLCDLAEKFLGRYHEGVIAPERFFESALEFDTMNPHATRREWALFATNLMSEAYRDGYIRGREYIDRDRDEWFPDPRPEVIANALMPGWDDPINRAVDVPDAVVSNETETDRIKRQLKELYQ